MRRIISSSAVVVSLVASIALGASPAHAGDANTISGGGASFQGDFSTKCAAKFSAKSGKSVSYAVSSSGTGRTNYNAGTFDFAGSDSYGSLSRAGVYIPITGAPIAFFANVGGVKTLKLDPATLSKIFKGQITTWNDPAIVALNKGVKLPGTTIVPQYRSGNSGTTSAVTNWFQQVLGDGWNGSESFSAGIGSPKGTASASSPALVSSTTQTAGGIGYADLSDVAGNKTLTIITVKNNAGQWVKPSVATAAKALSAQKTVRADGYVDIQYKRGTSGAYDLISYSYLIAPTGSGSAAAGLVKEYATFAVNTCMTNPKSIGAGNYAPISKTSPVGKKAVDQLGSIG